MQTTNEIYRQRYITGNQNVSAVHESDTSKVLVDSWLILKSNSVCVCVRACVRVCVLVCVYYYTCYIYIICNLLNILEHNVPSVFVLIEIPFSFSICCYSLTVQQQVCILCTCAAFVYIVTFFLRLDRKTTRTM